MKKILALVLAALMVAAVMTTAFAADAGSIKVTNAEIGKDYSLYRLFDATVAPDGKIAYKLKANDDVTNDTFFNQYFKIENGYVLTKDSSFTETVLKSDEFKTWATGFGVQEGSTITASSSTVQWSPIPYGYYYVTSTVGAVLTVDSANPAAEVIDKNQTVTFDKNIVEGSDLVKANQAGLDITVPFDITVNAKNYDKTDKIFKYVITDTMDAGWTILGDPVVKIGNTTMATKVKDTDYTLTYKKADGTTTTTLSEAKSFVIVIPWTSDGTIAGNFLYEANDKINVTYSAKLDPAKAAEVHVGTTPNLNEAEVDYYKGNDQPDHPSGDLGKKTTKTWETGLTIIKHDGDNNILTGAQFTLTSTNGTKVSYVYEKKYVEHTGDGKGSYYKLKDDTYTSEAPNGNAAHDSVYASITVTYDLKEEAKVMGENQTPSTISSYVGADGTVTFTGLGAGHYKIEETVVPAGYNKADDIEFDIEYTIDDNKSENATLTWSSTNNKVTLNGTTKMFETTVVNNKGVELPSTGGIGTTLFYVGGGLLALIAVVLLVTKRRMSSND